MDVLRICAIMPVKQEFYVWSRTKKSFLVFVLFGFEVGGGDNWVDFTFYLLFLPYQIFHLFLKPIIFEFEFTQLST